jgi:hypothetical protein
VSTKRERLLEWIRQGDPEDVPILIGPGFEPAASYLGKDARETGWAEAIRAAEETGTHNFAILHSPMPHEAVPFLDDVHFLEARDTTKDGSPRLTTWLETPEGTLRSVQEFPPDKGSYHREFFVEDEADLRVLEYFIRRTTDEIVTNEAVRRRVEETIRDARLQARDAFPNCMWVFCPAVELTSCYYMGQQTAIYALYDHRELMEELMALHWRTTEIWMEIGADTGIDIYGYAINGYEWLSPDLYERYMIPQAQQINAIAAAQGRLSWLHTCGKLKHIAAAGMYQRIGADIVESLSAPPSGDVDDLAETRRAIGPAVTTRGGINCELLYSDDPEDVRLRVEELLSSTRGFRHMVGDTNPSYPAYPWANIEATIEVVREQGRLFD